jgi:hypothetical protein
MFATFGAFGCGSMKTAIQAELPEQLVADARAFVEEGWAGDFDELLAEALRCYLESHSSRLAESFIREFWGHNTNLFDCRSGI